MGVTHISSADKAWIDELISRYTEDDAAARHSSRWQRATGGQHPALLRKDQLAAEQPERRRGLAELVWEMPTAIDATEPRLECEVGDETDAAIANLAAVGLECDWQAG